MDAAPLARGRSNMHSQELKRAENADAIRRFRGGDHKL